MDRLIAKQSDLELGYIEVEVHVHVARGKQSSERGTYTLELKNPCSRKRGVDPHDAYQCPHECAAKPWGQHGLMWRPMAFLAS